MDLIEKNQLVSFISPPINKTLAEKLVEKFVSVERRYIQCDWEPAELDGGQFAEVLAQLLHSLDSLNTNQNKGFD